MMICHNDNLERYQSTKSRNSYESLDPVTCLGDSTWWTETGEAHGAAPMSILMLPFFLAEAA